MYIVIEDSLKRHILRCNNNISTSKSCLYYMVLLFSFISSLYIENKRTAYSKNIISSYPVNKARSIILVEKLHCSWSYTYYDYYHLIIVLHYYSRERRTEKLFEVFQQNYVHKCLCQYMIMIIASFLSYVVDIAWELFGRTRA